MKRCGDVLPALGWFALMAVLLCGCGKTTTTSPDPDTGPFPAGFPSTADHLMANFKAAYEARDVAALAGTMHPLSAIILQAPTADAFPDVGATLDCTEQLRIIERMFSKQDVVDPTGRLVAGIQTISFQTFQRTGAWTPSLPTDPIQGAESALFAVEIQFDRGQTHSIMKVVGDIRFFVTHRDSTVNGDTRPFYRMRGQADLTDAMKLAEAAAKGSETSAWGSVHALFR